MFPSAGVRTVDQPRDDERSVLIRLRRKGGIDAVDRGASGDITRRVLHMQWDGDRGDGGHDETSVLTPSGTTAGVNTLDAEDLLAESCQSALDRIAL